MYRFHWAWQKGWWSWNWKRAAYVNTSSSTSLKTGGKRRNEYDRSSRGFMLGREPPVRLVIFTFWTSKRGWIFSSSSIPYNRAAVHLREWQFDAANVPDYTNSIAKHAWYTVLHGWVNPLDSSCLSTYSSSRVHNWRPLITVQITSHEKSFCVETLRVGYESWEILMLSSIFALTESDRLCRFLSSCGEYWR